MSRLFKTPEEAEAAFYAAIERADIKALDAVWSDDENIVCVHLGASRIEGRKAVMESFVELFSDVPVLTFSIVDALYTGNESLAVHLVREEIELEGQCQPISTTSKVVAGACCCIMRLQSRTRRLRTTTTIIRALTRRATMIWMTRILTIPMTFRLHQSCTSGPSCRCTNSACGKQEQRAVS